MQGTTRSDEPAKAKQTTPLPGRGRPSTAAVQSVRKDLTVRVVVTAPAVPEGEELKEDGYGHGV